MAGKTGKTALQTAMQGGKVSDNATKSALTTAVGRIASLTRRANTTKEALVETGTRLVHTAETQGSLFLASMAEGYLGEDKIRLGSVDLRAPIGLFAQGYGLYQTMQGQKGAGDHVLAIGTGVMGSWLANVARNAGRTLAEKRNGPPAPILTSPTLTPPVTLQGPMALLPDPGVAGPVREVFLTPEPLEGEIEEVGRRPGRRIRRAIRRWDARRDARRDARQSEDDDAVSGDDGRFVRAANGDLDD